jgi:hypothetical protein
MQPGGNEARTSVNSAINIEDTTFCTLYQRQAITINFSHAIHSYNINRFV